MDVGEVVEVEVAGLVAQVGDSEPSPGAVMFESGGGNDSRGGDVRMPDHGEHGAQTLKA